MFWCIYPHLPRKTTHHMLGICFSMPLKFVSGGMRFHTTCRCLVWILRIAAEEHHASRFGFHRHHCSVLLVWRCLEDEFATVKILQEQKLRWKMHFVENFSVFLLMFFLRVEDGSCWPHLFNKDRQQKGPGINISTYICCSCCKTHVK